MIERANMADIYKMWMIAFLGTVVVIAMAVFVFVNWVKI